MISFQLLECNLHLGNPTAIGYEGTVSRQKSPSIYVLQFSPNVVNGLWKQPALGLDRPLVVVFFEEGYSTEGTLVQTWCVAVLGLDCYACIWVWAPTSPRFGASELGFFDQLIRKLEQPQVLLWFAVV